MPSRAFVICSGDQPQREEQMACSNCLVSAQHRLDHPDHNIKAQSSTTHTRHKQNTAYHIVVAGWVVM